jgi:lipoyl(octanoyl) transferase
MAKPVQLHRLGLLPYHDAWGWQRRTAEAVRAGGPEALAVLQHPPVYTFGRRVRPENILVTPADAEVVESDRGGDVTYHGPGQLVAYPILDLRRRNLGAPDYVRLLEEAMIRTAAAFGVEACRIPGRPGVWVDAASIKPAAKNKATPAKLGAVGVRVQSGVATHGLALNVTTDLSRFDAIVPCGLAGIRVTSLQRELGYAPCFDAAEDTLIAAFELVFDCCLDSARATKSSQATIVHGPSLNVGEGRAAGVRPAVRLGR